MEVFSLSRRTTAQPSAMAPKPMFVVGGGLEEHLMLVVGRLNVVAYQMHQ